MADEDHHMMAGEFVADMAGSWRIGQASDIDVALTARSCAYEMWRRLLAHAPTGDLLRVLAGDGFRDAVMLVCEDDAKVQEFVASLAAVAREGECEALGKEYTRCFVGPRKLPAYPWESVNLEAEGVLFGRSTLSVRRAYAAQGLALKRLGSEPDDHIALELQFMGILASRAFEEWREGDRDACVANLIASESFLNDHLNQWVPLYAAAFAESSERGFYCCAVEALKRFLAEDHILLKELESELEE